MKTSRDRILTSHVGSLPRSEDVVRLLEAREIGTADDAGEFDRGVRKLVLDLAKRQAEIGIDIISDGESSKISYATYVHDRLTGFSADSVTPKPHLDVAPFPDFRRKMGLLTGKQQFKRVACVGPVAPRGNDELQKDLANLREAVETTKPADAFMNAASPGVVATFLPNKFYPTHEAYIDAIADAMRPEYQAIVAAGFNIQIDCPDLAMARHTAFQDLSEADFLKRARYHVEALNRALEGIPSDKVRMHVCWGNYEGPHNFDIDFGKIADIVLSAKAGLIALEAANPRHEHEWQLWKQVKLPEDKVLMPGVIDTSTNYIEHPDLVAERIVRFADVVGRERVIAGTDCGFGTSAGYGKIDPGIAFLKLGALVEGARRASKRLWR